MNVKKLSVIVTAALVLLSFLTGCSVKEDKSKTSSVTSTSADNPTVNVAVIKGPSGVGIVNLMESNENETALNKYKFVTVSSPEEIVAKISSKEADIATPPTNLAAVLNSKTSGKIQMLAASTKGVLYILENGNTIKNVSDLKGKTIYSTGQGANPEYVLNYILNKNGIDPDKDVNIMFKSENEELAALLVKGTAKIALVPEPIVTTVKTKKPDLRVALDMTNEWEKVSSGESQLLMGCAVGRKEFIDKNPQVVINFLKEYKESIKKATDDIDNSAALCEKYGIIPKKAIAKSAIPRCSLTYIDGNDMMKQIKGYYDVLYTANPKSVGGALPDDSFYYNAQK